MNSGNNVFSGTCLVVAKIVIISRWKKQVTKNKYEWEAFKAMHFRRIQCNGPVTEKGCKILTVIPTEGDIHSECKSVTDVPETRMKMCTPVAFDILNGVFTLLHISLPLI